MQITGPLSIFSGKVPGPKRWKNKSFESLKKTPKNF